MSDQLTFFKVKTENIQTKQVKRHVKRVPELSIFDIDFNFVKPINVKKVKLTRNVMQGRRMVASCKWKVLTRYYDDGRVVASRPEQMDAPTVECGWSSKEGNGFYEWTDIFDTESGAKKYLRDLEKEYKASFEICA